MISIRKYLYNLVFLLSNLLFPVITFAYAARVLEPEGIGKVQMVLNLAQYFVIAAGLGLPVYGVREVAKVAGDPQKLSNLLSGLLLINAILSGVLLLLYFTIVVLTGWFREDPGLYLLGGVLILTGFLGLDWFYTGMQRFRFLSVRSLVVKAVALAALFVFVKDREDLLIYLSINILTTVVTNGWNALSLGVRLTFKDLRLRDHIKGLTLLFLITVIVSVYTLGDTLLVGFMAGEGAAGLYTASVKISKLAIPLIVSLGMILIPEISRLFTENDSGKIAGIIRKSFIFTCLVGVPVSFGLYSFAPEFLFVFSGPSFTDATSSLRILAFLPIAIGMGHLFGLQILISGGSEKKYLVAVSVGMGISLILNLLLIPRLRETGAAIANLSAEIAVTLLCLYFSFALYKIRIDFLYLLKTGIIASSFILISYLLRTGLQSPWLILTLGGVLCAGVYGSVVLLVMKPHRELLTPKPITDRTR